MDTLIGVFAALPWIIGWIFEHWRPLAGYAAILLFVIIYASIVACMVHDVTRRR